MEEQWSSSSAHTHRLRKTTTCGGMGIVKVQRPVKEPSLETARVRRTVWRHQHNGKQVGVRLKKILNIFMEEKTGQPGVVQNQGGNWPGEHSTRAITPTGEARDMEPQGPGVRAAGGPAELQGI
jgi:hypothetical protein